MIEEIWKQIMQNKDVRQNLSRLRQGIKDGPGMKQFLVIIGGEEERLTALLCAEDAKTRKNAALLMGEMGKQEYFLPIYQAYQAEQQRFIRSSYLTAMGNLDYRAQLPELRDRLEELAHMEAAEEEQKHVLEEMRELSALIVRAEGVSAHRFTGWNDSWDVVLLTNRNYPALTKDELLEREPEAMTKLFGAGVMARVNNLHWTEDIRTYQELLFRVKGMETCALDPLEAASEIAGSQLLKLLESSHRGDPPFYFRVEFKSKRPLDEKSTFVKKLSGLLEKLSGRRLINTTADYEVELRVIENKEGNCNLLVKLFTWKDERFAYRKEVIPASIRPVNAALAVALAKEYMKENAQILDPFCGTGTMLIERGRAVKTYSGYGLDIQEDAILKARKNTEAAGQILHFINRDFFRFQHDYLFDEVITDMPFALGRITDEEVRELYRQFFATVGGFLKKDGIMILYSHNRELTEQLAGRNGFHVFQKFEISRKEGTYVMLLEMKGRK